MHKCPNGQTNTNVDGAFCRMRGTFCIHFGLFQIVVESHRPFMDDMNENKHSTLKKIFILPCTVIS